MAYNLEITKSAECVHQSKVTTFLCLTKLLTDRIFQPTKHNTDELNAKLPDHSGSQSYTYVSENNLAKSKLKT